ncbi:HAD family hydrolase [Candidatus Woesearchaeota archaeon]|nr:HAD family hydrolase [Candidatus Woesearchaeota archaeon]
MVKLIILDVYGTILKSDGRLDGAVRPGLEQFMDFYRPAKIVVFTDADLERITADLQVSGLTGKFDGVYHSEHLVSELRYKHLHSPVLRKAAMRLRGNVKDLGRVCKDFSIPKRSAIYIGDNFHGRDIKSAELNKIRFIRVPQFRTNIPYSDDKDSFVEYDNPDNLFSFESLIGKL